MRSTVLAKKRSPETFEKRRRALEKQRKRADKLADRLERQAAKRDAKERGEVHGSETDMSAYFGPDERPGAVPEAEEEEPG